MATSGRPGVREPWAYGEGGGQGQWHGGMCATKETAMAKDDPERAARLAEALRQNLRRRKAQAREAEVVEDHLSPGPPRSG